jgi:hypothetical protein
VSAHRSNQGRGFNDLPWAQAKWNCEAYSRPPGCFVTHDHSCSERLCTCNATAQLPKKLFSLSYCRFSSFRRSKDRLTLERQWQLYHMCSICLLWLRPTECVCDPGCLPRKRFMRIRWFAYTPSVSDWDAIYRSRLQNILFLDFPGNVTQRTVPGKSF